MALFHSVNQFTCTVLKANQTETKSFLKLLKTKTQTAHLS